MFDLNNIKSKKYYLLLLISIILFALSWGMGTSFSNNNIFANSSAPTEKKQVVLKSNNAEGTLKIVQMSDLHLDSIGRDNTKRLLADSTDLFKDAVDQTNELKNVDMVVFSGDVINRADEHEFMKFLKLANNLQSPWFIAPGNHDIGIFGGLNKKRYITLLNSYNKYFNSKKTYYAIEPKKGYLVLFMDGVIDSKITANGEYSEEQLKWLNEELLTHKNSKVIIVQHFPVVEPSHSPSHEVLNADEYLSVINKYKNVIAILSGHYHETKIQQKNCVIHAGAPALIEYPNAFRVITFKELKFNKDKKVEVIFDFKETRLKELQNKSKSRAQSTDLAYGKSFDRNATIVIDKKCKK